MSEAELKSLSDKLIQSREQLLSKNGEFKDFSEAKCGAWCRGMDHKIAKVQALLAHNGFDEWFESL